MIPPIHWLLIAIFANGSHETIGQLWAADQERMLQMCPMWTSVAMPNPLSETPVAVICIEAKP